MIRERHLIDGFKLATFAVVLWMMGRFDAWDNPTAWLYLAIHGSYGVLWTLKSRIFGDAQWERPLTAIRTLGGVVVLSSYWIAPLLICHDDHRAAPAVAAVAVALYAIGVFLHFAADMQKWMHLRLRPGTLLDYGLWAKTRNPNYLGELLIYGSFALLAGHPVPWMILAFVVGAVWVPNMRRKDRSLSRHSGFPAWEQKSTLLVPWLL